MTDVHIPTWTLQDRLSKARHEAEMTQGDLAARLRIARTTIANYEQGVTVPRYLVLRAWAEECAVPLAWLLGDEDDTVTLGYRHELGLNGMGHRTPVAA